MNPFYKVTSFGEDMKDISRWVDLVNMFNLLIALTLHKHPSLATELLRYFLRAGRDIHEWRWTRSQMTNNERVRTSKGQVINSVESIIHSTTPINLRSAPCGRPLSTLPSIPPSSPWATPYFVVDQNLTAWSSPPSKRLNLIPRPITSD